MKVKKQASAFLKKSAQKTFVRSRWLSGHSLATQKPWKNKSFFASFFAKKEVLPSFPA